MKRNRSIKLLTKTTFIYLLFTFIAFFISALFLTNEANEFIKQDLENSFKRTEHKVQRELIKGDFENKNPNRLTVFQLSVKPDLINYPQYLDTIIYNPEFDENQYFRIKKVIIEANDLFFETSMIRSMDDFVRLRDDIFEAMIPAFLLLSIGIVLFNYFLSGFIFKPFNKILGLMKTYKVGNKTELHEIQTTTLEFKRMQELFHQMIVRIENDYKHLKEYTENMAHEMQTPLTIIRNKTENLIADNSVMIEHSENIKIIYDQTNHLSKLGNTLNLLTKIENQEFNQTKKVYTKSEIEKHIVSITDLTRLKSLRIETNLSDDHYLNIDPYLWEIIIKNLLRNAVSYSSENESICITTNEKVFIISNYGSPLDFPVEKLFERFYHNNYKKSSIGLGLALVKKICEINNLNISYEYKENRHFFIIREN